MAFRIEKRVSAIVTGLLVLVPAVFGQELRYEAEYVHGMLGHSKTRGSLTITDSGISFNGMNNNGKERQHSKTWQWAYQDIQQLRIAPKTLSVLTYNDNKWKLGADREYQFDLVSDKTFEDAYNVLRTRLDQRFVAEMPENISSVQWEIPVKHLHTFRGDQGLLQVGPEAIVYRSLEKGQSRTWRYEDIENISSSGPFRLTITTFERARTQYGDYKGFNFELKQPLTEVRYNELWLKLNERKGLRVLSGYRE